MTQNQAILKHLKRYGTITQLEAIREIGCTRLASRIFELKRCGNKIKGYMVRVKTRNGFTNVKKYYYVK